jgi:WD40 repeat protein
LTASSDARLLASASDDGSVKLWDAAMLPCSPSVATATAAETASAPLPLCTFTGHASFISACALDDRAALLAACDVAGEVRLWDLRGAAASHAAAAQPVASLRVRAPAASVAFAPACGALLLTASGGVAQLWDLRMLRPCATEARAVSSAASPVRRQALARARAHTDAVWGASPTPPPPSPAAPASIWARTLLASSAAGNAAAEGAESSAAPRRRAAAAAAAVAAAACSPPPRRCASAAAAADAEACAAACTYACANADAAPRFCEASGRFEPRFTGHPPGCALLRAAFTPDGLAVLTSGDDGGHRLWDAASGRGTRTVTPPHAPCGTPSGALWACRPALAAAAPCARAPLLLAGGPSGGGGAVWHLGAPPARGGAAAGVAAAPPLRFAAGDHAAGVAVRAAALARHGLAAATGDAAGRVAVRRAGDAAPDDDDA